MEQEDIEIPDIAVEDQVFDIQFHPSEDVIAIGTIDGAAELCAHSHFLLSVYQCLLIL